VRRIRGRSAASVLISAAIVAVFVCAPLAASAAPTTARIRALQAQAATADTKLQDLDAQLELKQTDLQAFDDALANTRSEEASTEARLADVQARLDASEAVLDARADAIYRGGASDFLSVLVGTTDFEDFVTRVELLNRITASDTDLIAQISADRDGVAQAKTSLLNREAEEVALRARAQAAEAEVRAAVSSQKAYVASLSTQIKALMKAEEDRLAKAAAALARRAAVAAKSAPPRSSDDGSLGAPHPEALAVAKQFLGVPYLWGGRTPAGFDCSGFVQYCYAKIGISIPRTSRQQFTIGKFIPASRTDLLEPGDLVFFAYGGDPSQIHHVGMYAGGGVFINAPGAGDHVKYSSLTGRIAARADYVGAVRP
jgi:cell wall-associated NlpC family hydrolase